MVKLWEHTVIWEIPRISPRANGYRINDLACIPRCKLKVKSFDLQNSAMAAQQLHHSPAPAVPHLGNGFHHHTPTQQPAQQQQQQHGHHGILSPAARRPPFVPSVSVHPQPPVGGTYKCQVGLGLLGF